MAAKKKFDFKDMATKVVSASGGGVLASLAVKKVPVANEMIRSIGGIAIGSALVGFGGGNKIMESGGAGFIGASSGELASALIPGLGSSNDATAGVGNLDYYASEFETEEVSGYDNEISGNDESAVH